MPTWYSLEAEEECCHVFSSSPTAAALHFHIVLNIAIVFAKYSIIVVPLASCQAIDCLLDHIYNSKLHECQRDV